MEWGNHLSYILLSSIFVAAGFGKIKLVAFHKEVSTQCGLPVPHIAVPVAAAVDLLGAACLISGFFVWQAALALAAYVVLVTLVFYARWFGTPQWWYEQMSQTFKNAAIIGGLLLAAKSDPLWPHWF